VDKINVQLRISAALFERLINFRLLKGWTLIQCLEQALPGYLTQLEAQEFRGAIYKKAGDHYPPRPDSATNRRGGSPPTRGSVKITSALLPAEMATRLISASYWRREPHTHMVEAALREWLDQIEGAETTAPQQGGGATTRPASNLQG